MRGRRHHAQLLHALSTTPADLVLLTGDYMDRPGNERAALDVLRDILEAARARLGIFGIAGNHDSTVFMRLARGETRMEWLNNQAVDLLVPAAGAGGESNTGTPLRLIGLSWPEDVVAAVLDEPPTPAFTIALAHSPTAIIPAGEFGIPLLFAGHTHGGQVRISGALAPHTSSDLPPDLASGLLRYRRTLAVISRGLGEAVFPGLRFNCPRQAPLITLRSAPFASNDTSQLWDQQVVRSQTW
ncbi:MAG: metallophosphoesterase [Phycisphaerae bacterium]|nr:metallophosphoesterase [Phycisphaerae bacterium]